MMELLKQLDYAIWALLRMHRLLPFAPQAVYDIVPRPVLAKLPKTEEYCQLHNWDVGPQERGGSNCSGCVQPRKSET